MARTIAKLSFLASESPDHDHCVGLVGGLYRKVIREKIFDGVVAAAAEAVENWSSASGTSIHRTTFMHDGGQAGDGSHGSGEQRSYGLPIKVIVRAWEKN